MKKVEMRKAIYSIPKDYWENSDKMVKSEEIYNYRGDVGWKSACVLEPDLTLWKPPH